MNFFNIGGGELLVIILLALLMFGPKDIMNIMRTVGKYARAASRAWAQIVASLQGDLMPDEIREVVDDTQNSIKEVRQSFTDIGQSMNEIQTSVREDVKDLDQPLQVQMPNALAEVKAEAEARKSQRAQRSLAQDPGVKEMLTMFEKTAPPPTPAKSAEETTHNTESPGVPTPNANPATTQSDEGNSAHATEPTMTTNEDMRYGE
ncbi:MAG: twin-arginine translocase TatA/TatE family subunit [Anaerolineae bacterium]|nr:twin-arginine translocase TatA/TatE family subunit [Anaerolineae bacterium]